MLSPEDQQVQICLLKSNLEEIEKSLIVQRSALPQLDEENEQQTRAAMGALRVSRAQNDEIERLKQENVRLAAKRTQLKGQCEALAAALQEARENRSRLAQLLWEEERTDERNIRAYEDSLRDKAERFRQTQGFYNEEHMIQELENVNYKNSELEDEVARRRKVVSYLRVQLEALEPDVPEDLPAILGKMELHEKLRLLTSNREELRLKLNELNKKAPSIIRI